MPRSLRILVGWFIAALVVLLAIALWRRPPVLRQPVRHSVLAEKASRAGVDSQLTALYREATAAQARRDTALVHAAQLERAARRHQHRADSLAIVASLAASAADSARAYHAAYDARTIEADSLRAANDTLHTGLSLAQAEAIAWHRAATVSAQARQRADSVLDAVVSSVAKSTCTIPGTFGRVGCPSRTAAFVTGGCLVIGTVLAVRQGWVTNPLHPESRALASLRSSAYVRASRSWEPHSTVH